MIRIRKARPPDARAVVKLEKEVSAVPGLLVTQPDEVNYAETKRFIEQAARGIGCFFVAEEQRAIVGFAFLRPMSVRAAAHIYRLTIVLALTHAGHGLGTRLMRALIAWARKSPQVRKIELLVRASNRVARKLYRNFGFQVEGRLRQRVRLPNGSFVDDVSMAWFSRPMPANP
jgi:RimJ/RimL family protein N-acetyltransferase